MSDDKVKPPGDASDIEVTSILDPDFDAAKLEGEEFEFDIDDILGEEESSPAVDEEPTRDPGPQTLGEELDVSDFSLDESMLAEEDSPAVDDVEDDFDFELLEVIEDPAGAAEAETETSPEKEDLLIFDAESETEDQVEPAIAETGPEDDLDLGDLMGDTLEDQADQPTAKLESQDDLELNPEEESQVPETPAAGPDVEPAEDLDMDEVLAEPAEPAVDVPVDLMEEGDQLHEESSITEPIPGPQLEIHSVLDQERLETIVRDTVQETVTSIIEKMLPGLIEDVVSQELEKIKAELEEN